MQESISCIPFLSSASPIGVQAAFFDFYDKR